MLSRDPFWDSINTLPALRGTDILWRKHFGTAYDRARQFMRGTTELACNYPCNSPCGLGCYMVVRHVARGTIAICPDEFPQADPIDLSTRDVVMHEFDIGRLAEHLCQKLSIEPLDKPHMLTRWAWDIGSAGLPCGKSINVAFAIQINGSGYTHVAEKLLSRGRTAHVLLVPCSCDAETRRLIEDNDGYVLALSDIAPLIYTDETPLRPLATIIASRKEPIVPEYMFRKSGTKWSVRWAGGQIGEFGLRKGFAYMKTLIDHPNQSYDAIDLHYHHAKIKDPKKLGDQMNVAGDMRKHTLEKELNRLKDDYHIAEACGDNDRMAEIQAERANIAAAITEYFGSGGRPRTTGDPKKKAADAVGKAVAGALKALMEHGQPELAAHLSSSITTGSELAYRPDRDIHWNI